MRYLLGLTPIILLSALIVQPKPDYSYDFYYRHVSNYQGNPCSLSGQTRENIRDNFVVLCDETGEQPTRSEIVVWEGYVLWSSCYQYSNPLACDELEN